ncbi:S-layer homology domain-containing protein [Cohnella nanjingensis]|uniref:S-layer homology domain-containing protein n=1 Tax=Cohnella nanjingensis TaxID=1387779 RepID=A0A7X0RU72_9BACL|nr:S-layer homology domain-containing protein [Cohnella nanjingensis]MBB6672199.1 S-layer homology domain-containing protein [Cohnella nanjingensis]
MYKVGKKGIVLCLATALLFTNAVSVSAGFADSEKHWAAKEIDRWTSKGVISGGTNGKFEPNRSMTRAEFVSVLSRVFQYTDKSEKSFPDVREASWYADALSKAVAAGVLSGDGRGKLRPDSPISRLEAAAVLYRAFQSTVRDKSVAGTFKDADQIAAWGRDAVSALVENGYISGRPGNAFAPNAPVTRAEAVKMLDGITGDLKNAAGTYTGSVDTNLVVNTRDVVLKDMTIKGNLILAEGIGDGDVTLDHVKVQGQTFVRGGGEHGVRLIDSVLNGDLVVEKKDGKVRIYAQGATEVSRVDLRSGAILEGDYAEVNMEVPGITVQIIRGTVSRLIVHEPGSVIQMAPEARVTNMTANAEVAVKGKGEIGTANIHSNNVTIERQPGTTIVAPHITAHVGGNRIEGGDSGTTVGAGTNPTPSQPAPSNPTPGNPTPSDPASANTGIRVKPGQEAVVTGIWPETLQVAYSTNVGQLLAAVQSVDSSAQTYEIFREKGGTKLSTSSTVLMTANILRVTAADGTAAEYEITVNPVGDAFMLTPIATTAGSEASGSNAVHATNNAGMSGYYGVRDSHDQDASGATMWLTEDNPGTDNWIQVDLGAVYPLGNMLVWNYNQPGATNSGIKNAQLLYSADGSSWTVLGGTGATRQFAQAAGSASQTAETAVDFGGVAARYVKIVPNAAAGDGNWGAAGPTRFGLSQLRIYRYASHVTASGQNITVLDVSAGSVNSTDTPAIHTVNNYGMSGTSGKSDTHGNRSAEMWLTAPNPGANNWIQFDLGGTYPLSEMRVWNYNAQAGKYGIKNAQVQYSVDGRAWTNLGSYQFARASGSAAQGPTDLAGGGAVQFNAASARYVKIVPNTAAGDGNWGSEAVFGLSQVRFYSAPGTIIEPERDWTALVAKTSGWTGSDGIYTIAYNGYDAPGKADETQTLFLFSDTFVGNVNPVTKYRNVADFTNNTLGVLTGGSPDPAAMNYLWGTDGNGQTSTGLFVPQTPDASSDGWYWFQDGINLNNNIYISAMNVAPDPSQPPGWQFKVVGVSTIKIPIDHGRLDIANHSQVDTSLLYHTEFQWGTKPDGSPNMLSLENQFGAGFMANTAEAGAPAPDGYIYIYGYQTVFGVRGLLVARVLPEDFEEESKWRFYTDGGWVNDISKAKIISHSSVDVSPELSVTPIIGGPNDGKYRLVYSTGLFSGDHGLIKQSIGDTPFGPFGPADTLYYTPEDKSSAAETYIYNAKAHPNISKPGELLITYNVNSTQDGGNVHYNNGEMYHPRFINMRQIYSGTNTEIAVKSGQGRVITAISAGEIRVVDGTTADGAIAAINSADGSIQTYEVYASANGSKLADGTAVLATGNVLKVTSADNTATAYYAIQVDESRSNRTDIAVKPEFAYRIGTDGMSVVDAAYGTTVDELRFGIGSADGSPQSYLVLESPGGPELAGAARLAEGQLLRVTAEDGVMSADYAIHIVERFISGVTATAGSEESAFGMTAEQAVNHSGMSGLLGRMNDTHDNRYSAMWRTTEDNNDDNDWIRFDLGGNYSLGEMVVWNYNEDDGTGWLKNGIGIRYAAVEYSLDGMSWTTLGGAGYRYQFAKATNGTTALAPTNLVDGGVVDFGGVNARYVRISPNSATNPNPGNYGGVFEGAFGIKSLFGLSEVRFYTAALTP